MLNAAVLVRSLLSLMMAYWGRIQSAMITVVGDRCKFHSYSAPKLDGS